MEDRKKGEQREKKMQKTKCVNEFSTSYGEGERGTRPDTRHKMRLVSVLLTFKNNTGRTDLRTYGPTEGRTRPLIEMRRRI